MPVVDQPQRRSESLEEALAAARKRGEARAAEVLGGDDMLTATVIADRLGTTRATVDRRRRAGRLLGLRGARRGFRYPAWQLGPDGKPHAELPVLLELLGGPWAVYRFLVQTHGSLRGLTGRQALERGRGRSAVAAAEGIARGDFT